MGRKAETLERARRYRGELSATETRVWRLLRGRRFHGFKFRRQHPIGPFVVDFACVSARLVVEVDGDSHRMEEQRLFDAERTAFLEKAGWRVVRVSNGVVEADPSGTETVILVALGALGDEGD